MDGNAVAAIVLGCIVTGAVNWLLSSRLITYQTAENKKAIEDAKEKHEEDMRAVRAEYDKKHDALGTELRDLSNRHHGHNRELGEMKQLLSTTNTMVAQIHNRFFKETTI